MNNLEFARELHKTFLALGQDVRLALFFKLGSCHLVHNNVIIMCICIHIIISSKRLQRSLHGGSSC